MKRYTQRTDMGYTIPDHELQEAVYRLAAYEDIYDEVAGGMRGLPSALKALRADGKEKTVRYRELLGQKLLYNQIAALYERHGIMFDSYEGN